MREFDIVIWGATGFTGRLVAEYILEKYGIGGELNWAIAGRNAAKLDEIIDYLGGAAVPKIVANSTDRASLDAMCSRTRVICTTVGPYALYGDALVAACIANKTDYCDLTGEVQWMRRMIDKHGAAAKAAGVRIVHTCGFDSIPSDMGVYFAQREIKKQYGEYAQQIKFRLKAAKGGMSGGTYASLGNVLVEAEKDKSIYQTLFDPYGLNPNDGVKGSDRPDLQKVIYDKDAKSWLTPFIMAVINTKVVRRSHALAGYPYGQDFNYDEAMMTGDGIGGRMKALAALTATGVMMSAKPGSILKKITDRVLPDPGEGPNKAQRENGFYNIRFYCKMRNGDLHQVVVKGDRDPGYGSTSKMLGESAVCLAKDGAKTPAVSGILTPSVAMGDALLERLIKNAGLTFELK
jgi:short subunit dehydrogenase-like uncharacterized protein